MRPRAGWLAALATWCAGAAAAGMASSGGALLAGAGVLLASCPRRRWTALTALFLLAFLWGRARGEVVKVQQLVALDRPVTVTGRVDGCWSAGAEDRRAATLLVEALRQGPTVHTERLRLRVLLPAESVAWPCGGRWRLRGHLRPPSTYRNRPVVVPGGWSLGVKSPRLAEPIEPPGRLLGGVGRWREALLRERPAAGEAAALARALVLADRSALPWRWELGLRRAGLAHLLALSGLHVGLVALGATLLLLPLPSALRSLGIALLVGAFVVGAGAPSSALRAGLMLGIGAAGLGLGRPFRPGSTLLAATVALLVVLPGRIVEVGLQLSVAATAGLVAWTPALAARLRSLGWAGPALAATLAAQTATLPWALASFHRLTPVAPLLNLGATPWLAVALALSLAWGLLTAAGLPATPLLAALAAIVRPLDWLAAAPASSWWSSTTSWRGDPVALLTVAGTGTVVVALARGTGRRWLALVLLVGLLTPASAGDAGVALSVLDVGQGDGLLLQDGPRAVLVDGGGWRGEGFGDRVLRPALAGLGVRALDVVVVSHGHRDHCGGLPDLLREVPVGEVWMGPDTVRTACGVALSATSVPVRPLLRGETRRVGRWRLRVLWPDRGGGASANESSLVLEAAALGRSVLLTGDAEARLERQLVARGLRPVDLLKVAHHGSRTSSTARLLGAARPAVALISAGPRNPYGHPDPGVLRRLSASGATVLRTDRHGGVSLRWLGPRGWRWRPLAPGVD